MRAAFAAMRARASHALPARVSDVPQKSSSTPGTSASHHVPASCAARACSVAFAPASPATYPTFLLKVSSPVEMRLENALQALSEHLGKQEAGQSSHWK